MNVAGQQNDIDLFIPHMHKRNDSKIDKMAAAYYGMPFLKDELDILS